MLSVEQAKELRQSALFRAFCEEVLDRIEKLKNTMESCDVDDLVGLQHEIQVYRKVLNIPVDVIDRESL